MGGEGRGGEERRREGDENKLSTFHVLEPLYSNTIYYIILTIILTIAL